MRRSLFAAASIIALAAAPALAQEAEETIDDTREEPVETATASEGSPANLVIGTNGRVQLTDPAVPVVRVNSDNDFTMVNGSRVDVFDTDADGGDITIDGAVGVQVDPGVESDIAMSGTISMLDTYQATASADDLVDTDGDGVPDTADGEVDGPFATDRDKTALLVGAVDASGDAVAGQAGVTGDVRLENGSLINVQGQDSYGLRTVTEISGDVAADGRVNVTGENSRAVSIEADVGGDVTVRSIDVRSPGGNGVAVEADVGGGLRFVSGVRVSGYRIAQRLGEVVVAQFDPDDILDAGDAIIIAGHVQDGVFFSASSDIQYLSGGGAAVSIGRSGGAVEIGQTRLPDDFVAGAEDDDDDPEVLDHGVINQGIIAANSFVDGRATTAFLVAGLDENGLVRSVILGGDGFSNSGQISAIGYDGDATALRFGAGAQADEIRNTGAIFARALIGFDEDGNADDNPDTPEVEGRYAAGDSIALRLDENSQIRRLLNEQGDIIASVQEGSGPDASATAIRVTTDSLEEIRNTGRILASIIGNAPLGLEDQGGAQLIAIDARNHGGGLTVIQEQALDEAGDPTENAPEIEGQILFGSGDDTLDLRAGTITGAVSFGDGADRLIINGATVTGDLSDSDQNLTIEVTNGRLVLSGDQSLALTEARFNEGGALQIEIDTRNRSGAFLNASGDVTFASGSDLSIGLARLIGEGGEFEVISADTLTLDDEAVLTATDAPFLYNASIERSTADADTLVLSLTRKTSDQLGMNASQAAAYDEAFAAFEAIESLGTAFAAVRTADEFFSGYNQLLPEYSASAIQFALANNDAASGALATRLRNARLSPDSMAGVWAQEFGYFADRAGSALGPGYRGQGIGIAVGLDRPIGPFYAVGVKLVGSASEIEDVGGLDEPLVAMSGQVGGYAATELGGFDITGSLGLGYDYFESERLIQLGAFQSVNTADWSGWHVAASAVAGRDYTMGAWTLRPEASLTWLTLFESGYTETVEDTANAGIALTVDDRESTSVSAAATLDIVRRFGDDRSWWAPHVRMGYRGEFDDAMAETIAQFGEDGSPFTLRSSAIPGSGYLLGFGVSAGSNYSTFTFAYDADVRDGFVRHVGRLVIRLTF